jgi:hypothetical protein
MTTMLVRIRKATARLTRAAFVTTALVAGLLSGCATKFGVYSLARAPQPGQFYAVVEADKDQHQVMSCSDTGNQFVCAPMRVTGVADVSKILEVRVDEKGRAWLRGEKKDRWQICSTSNQELTCQPEAAR